MTLPAFGESAYEKKLKQETTLDLLDPYSQDWYLYIIDDLTTRLNACEERLEIKEEPPECKGGFPWKAVVVGAAAGYLAKDLID